MINLFQPTLDKEELSEIEKVLDSNWVGKGSYVSDFEQGFADHLRQRKSHFLSTTSCTESIS